MADNVLDFQTRLLKKQEQEALAGKEPSLQQQETQTLDLYLSIIEAIAEWSKLPVNKNVYGAQSIFLALMMAFKSYARKIKTNAELSDEEMVTLNRMTNDILKRYDIKGFDLIIRRGDEGAMQLTITVEEVPDDDNTQS